MISKSPLPSRSEGSFRDYRKGTNGRQRAKVLPIPFLSFFSFAGAAAKSRKALRALQEVGLGCCVGPNSLPVCSAPTLFPPSWVGEVAREVTDNSNSQGLYCRIRNAQPQQPPRGKGQLRSAKEVEAGGGPSEVSGPGGWSGVQGHRPHGLPQNERSQRR